MFLLKYDISVKTLAVQPMFSIVSSYKENRFYWTYANNYIAMKIRVLTESVWIQEGSGGEKERSGSILLIKT